MQIKRIKFHFCLSLLYSISNRDPIEEKYKECVLDLTFGKRTDLCMKLGRFSLGDRTFIACDALKYSCGLLGKVGSLSISLLSILIKIYCSFFCHFYGRLYTKWVGWPKIGKRWTPEPTGSGLTPAGVESWQWCIIFPKVFI